MVSWFFQDVSFTFKRKSLYNKWLNETASLMGQNIKTLSVIFCSDSFLRDLNRRFLQHDYYTDVIAFDTRLGSDWPGDRHDKGIEGDVYISIDSVKVNAQYYNVPFNEELARVMVHGLLHLLGLSDLSEEEQKVIRLQENAALQHLKRILNNE